MNQDVQLPESYYQSRLRLAFMLLGQEVLEISERNLSLKLDEMSDPLYKLAARCMAHIRLGKRLPCDTVYGHDRPDVALAEAFSHAAGVKRIELGIQPSGHRCSVIARHHGGPIGAHRVLILRDQVKTGGTIRKMAAEIRETGAEANYAIALLDWNNGAAEVLARENIELHAVFTVDELLDIFVDAGWLSKYRRATIGWQTAYA
jgi:orotate phosphoribosyltransferase